MTKADIVNEIAKTTGIDKPAVLSVVTLATALNVRRNAISMLPYLMLTDI